MKKWKMCTLICNLLIFANHKLDVGLWLIMLSYFWGPLKLYVKAKKAHIFYSWPLLDYHIVVNCNVHY